MTHCTVLHQQLWKGNRLAASTIISFKRIVCPRHVLWGGKNRSNKCQGSWGLPLGLGRVCLSVRWLSWCVALWWHSGLQDCQPRHSVAHPIRLQKVVSQWVTGTSHTCWLFIRGYCLVVSDQVYSSIFCNDNFWFHLLIKINVWPRIISQNCIFILVRFINTCFAIIFIKLIFNTMEKLLLSAKHIKQE